MSDLKPCEDCGGPAENIAKKPIGVFSGPVRCKNCGTQRLTVKAWNTRTQPAEAQEPSGPHYEDCDIVMGFSRNCSCRDTSKTRPAEVCPHGCRDGEIPCGEEPVRFGFTTPCPIHGSGKAGKGDLW